MAYSVEQIGAVFPDYCYCVGLHFLIREKIESKETGSLEQIKYYRKFRVKFGGH